MAEKGRILVVLQKGWPGPFKRTVTIGKVTSQLLFNPGEPVEVDSKTAKALARDIGQALNFCRICDTGKVEIIELPTESIPSDSQATD